MNTAWGCWQTCRATAWAAVLTGLVLTTTARAGTPCDDTVARGGVVGVAKDGTFVYWQTIQEGAA